MFTAVEPIDITIDEGEMVVVTGRSGSGKTTLMNMLAGLLEPTEGKVYAGEADLYELNDDDRSKFRGEYFGYIPQGLSAIYSMNVLENILLPYMLDGGVGEYEKRALTLMEELDIVELKDVKPKELSGGELRRMSIARALMKRPEIIFADEPTGDLDDENTTKVLDILRSLTQEGTSVFLVTHEDAALSYADQIYRMDGGKLEHM